MRVSGRLLALAVAISALLMLAVGSAAQAQEALRASALGPEAPLAKPSGGYVGWLNVSPEHGPAGTPLSVTADGLPAGQQFVLVWRTVKGRWKVGDGVYRGREYQPVGYEIARLRSDAEGRLAATFVAPEDFGFVHDIVLQQGDRLFTQTAFNLEMTVRLVNDSGPPGTPIEVEVKGIGWRQLQNSWLLLYDNNFTGWISAVTTGGSASFTIPATGAPGLHVIELLHGEFTFPYRNMQQSPEPDRPRFVLHFTITRGDPVLPPPLSAQTQTAVRTLPPPGELVAVPPFSATGQPVTMSGSGFAPERTYRLDWATVAGNRVAGGGWQESSRPVATAKADSSGRVTFDFVVPDDLGGAHALSVQDGERTATGTYWIAPSALPLDVDRGPAGTRFKIRLKGIGWTETANIYHVVYDNSYIGYACGFNSQGDVEIDLQATGGAGWHFIDLYPGIYKGAESRPINFRIPQLTHADDHPGEDLPRFRYAFLVVDD